MIVARIRRASYAEVVGYWISYEYNDRKDFRDYVDSHFPEADVKYIISPHDYNDSKANARRLTMLKGYRKFISWFSHAEWWVVSLSMDDISNLLVIHSHHWDLLSSGSVKALDIAKGIDEKKWKKLRNDDALSLSEPGEFEHIRTVAKEEAKKITTGLKRKVKSKNPSRIVVIGADGGEQLTVIDGVHRAVRLCLYYIVRGKKNDSGENPTQEAYLGLTPNPLQRTTKEWSDVGEFFERGDRKNQTPRT